MNTLKTLLLIATLAIAAASCSKEAPVPTNEKEDKGHEDPTRVEFVIRRGHLHGVRFHGDPESIIAPVQKFKFELDEKTKNWVRKDMEGNILSETSPVVMIEGAYYAMEIIYYNSRGKRMNHEFTTAQMLPIHQHFFEVKNYTDTKTNQVNTDAASLFTYTYRDTDPEHLPIGDLIDEKNSTKRSELTQNPLGLKGYFEPKKAYVKYDIRVSLFHVLRGIKNVDNRQGVFYPFNAPGDELIARSTTDFSQKIPVYVITSVASGGGTEAARYYKEVADYYKITPQKVKELIDEAREKHDSANYWM
jgi:hypothetical protein